MSTNQAWTGEVPMTGGFFRRHGWRFLLGLAVIIGLFGVGDMVNGLDADPAIAVGVTGMTPDEMRAQNEPIAHLADFQVRAGGLQLVVISVIWVITLLAPFRRGERWAWYSMWTFPAWAAAVSVSFLYMDLQADEPLPPPAISGWVFLALTSGLLLACRRDFFIPRGPSPRL